MSDTEARRSLLGMQLAVQLAIGKRLADDQWARTHCTRALTGSGRGVTHQPACTPWPVSVRWSADATDALNLRTPHPEPEPEPPTEPTWEDIQRMFERAFPARRLR